MAISWTSNPLSFDSAPGVSLRGYAGPAYIPSTRFTVTQVIWIGAVTNGDTFTLTDGKGNTIATAKAATATLGTPITIPVGQEYTDIQLTQISSGVVYVYLQHVD